MSRMRYVALALVALLALVGCERAEPEFSADDQVPAEFRDDNGADSPADDEAPPEGEVFTFVGVDIDYSAAPTDVAAGTVTFELVNEGAIFHDVTIEELNSEVVVGADPGQTATGTVALDPGEYTYFCSVPGHRAAGMEGTLTVS